MAGRHVQCCAPRSTTCIRRCSGSSRPTYFPCFSFACGAVQRFETLEMTKNSARHYASIHPNSSNYGRFFCSVPLLLVLLVGCWANAPQAGTTIPTSSTDKSTPEPQQPYYTRYHSRHQSGVLRSTQHTAEYEDSSQQDRAGAAAAGAVVAAAADADAADAGGVSWLREDAAPAAPRAALRCSHRVRRNLRKGGDRKGDSENGKEEQGEEEETNTPSPTNPHDGKGEAPESSSSKADPTPAPVEEHDDTQEDEPDTPAPSSAATAVQTKEPITPSPTSPPTPAPTEPPPPPPDTPAPAAEPTPSPTVVDEFTPIPTAVKEEEEEEVVETASPVAATDDNASQDDGGDDNSDKDKVQKPYFTDPSADYVTSATLHIGCDTKGATIYYTVDGDDPGKGKAGSRAYDSKGKVVVSDIGVHTVRAIGTKEGMEDSDVISKNFTVEERVATPVLTFEGEVDPYHREGKAYLRNVTITMDCETPNSTIYYTTDGVSSPTVSSPLSLSAEPGSKVTWVDEGKTTFLVAAFAYEMWESEVDTFEVMVVAPRLDEHDMAISAGGEGVGDMYPQVEVTAFESIFAPPEAELEQQEALGPGYGSCEGGSRTVRGKLLRLLNPRRHFSIAAPPNACAADGALALASETSRKFRPTRRNATLSEDESPDEARARLGLDVQMEQAWLAAESLGCQATVAAGMLSLPGGAIGCVGNLVTGGHVLRAENDSTGLVNFGVRGGKYVVGMVTAPEIMDESNPFQDLISGAGWLVRSGANYVEASAREGHLDILRPGWTGETEGDQVVGGLEDVLTAKLARSALGHDAEGRLILLQTSGAAGGADLDATIQDGLDLTELADVLIEAGAVNAINLVGGGPSAMTRNHSAIVDPSRACSDPLSFGGVEGKGGGDDDENGSAAAVAVPRCDVPVSSIVCVHADPPLFVPQASGGAGENGVLSSSSSDGNDDIPYGGDSNSPSSSAGAHGSGGSSSVDTSWSDDHEAKKQEERAQWVHEVCAGGNGTGNSTLWAHLDDVEEAFLRYKIAFWVVAMLGMLSLYFNIQHFKSSSPSNNNNSSSNGNAAIGNQHNNSSSSAGRIGNISITKGSGGGGLKMAHISTGVEMAKVSSSSRRGSRSKGRRHKGSKHDGGGGYAKLSGDVGDGDFEVGDIGPFGESSPSAAAALNGFYDEDSDQEEVDVSLIQRSRPHSKGKRDRGGKGGGATSGGGSRSAGRLKKALARVAKGGPAAAAASSTVDPPLRSRPPRGGAVAVNPGSDSDVDMSAINPFGGGAGGAAGGSSRRRSSGGGSRGVGAGAPSREGYEDAESWA